MKLPWTKRAEAAEREAAVARERRDVVVAQWPEVRTVAGESRHHRELNGFSNIIVAVARGKQN